MEEVDAMGAIVLPEAIGAIVLPPSIAPPDRTDPEVLVLFKAGAD
jgi:hypothetical protein